MIKDEELDSIILDFSPIVSKIDSVIIELNELEKSVNSINFFELIFGAVLGLVLSGLISFLYRSCRREKISKILSPYEGVYIAYDKFNCVEKKYFFELKRKNNLFFIDYGKSISKDITDFKAEITMAPPLYNSGKGFYQHEKNENNIIGFGFLDIQLAEANTILVHSTFSKDRNVYKDGYIWIKQEKTYSQLEKQFFLEEKK